MSENAPGPETRAIKTPPFLLLAVLLFWGWQSGLLPAGAVMGLILESARFVKVRWELSDADFRRILTFCTVLLLATAVYAFTSNEEGGSLSGLMRGPAAARNATLTSVRASSAFFRWLPMTLFLFMAAQTFGARERIPWTAISFFSYRRAQRERKAGHLPPPGGGLNISYPYFIVCLFSAGIHPNNGSASYFWGQCLLTVWALWPFRSRRYGIAVWAGTLTAVIVLGYFGQSGIGVLERVIENYNPQWFARFLRQRADPMQATTAIGRIGKLEMSGRIVIRLWTENHTPPPEYLREASYRTYFSPRQSWYAGTPRSDFANRPAETNQTTWVLLPDKTNDASVNIACYLNGWSQELGIPEGLLPLPTGSGRLENLNAVSLKENSEGAVLADGPGLVIFDARYGPGATIDSPPDTSTNQLDLTVPTNEALALEQVISSRHLAGRDEAQTLRNVSEFFRNHFTYSVWLGPDQLPTTNETPLARFLLTSRRGHCEYFATATVLLLRELNIPARYAVGYFVHEQSGGGYVVRERDAHAWCLVWDADTRTWENFDTTPASWVAEEGKRASFWQWLSDLRSWIGFQIAKFRWGQTNLRQYILWALVPLLALLLYQIIFRRGRRQPRRTGGEKTAAAVFWPGLDSEFYQLEQKLAARGVPRQPGEPLFAWLTRALEEPALKDWRGPLLELLRLHYRYRFDPRGLSKPERETLAREVKTCLAALSPVAGPR
jgi:protein-glutamine gamma-glutamyltransferase